MRIRIEGHDLPGPSCGPSPDSPDGYHNVHVAVQRRAKPAELLGLTPADAPAVSWTLDCTAIRSDVGFDLKGPHVQGPPGGRFIYLSWGELTGDASQFKLFRRAKLWLDVVPAATIEAAQDLGLLVGRLGLTDANGRPRCASVRPPVIDWSAAAA